MVLAYQILTLDYTENGFNKIWVLMYIQKFKILAEYRILT